MYVSRAGCLVGHAGSQGAAGQASNGGRPVPAIR